MFGVLVFSGPLDLVARLVSLMRQLEEAAQRQGEEAAQRQGEEAPLGSETPYADDVGTGRSALTQLDEDELFWQSCRVFGVGEQQPIRDRGESSTMATTRFTLECQVLVLE
ncbi:unnamed protein product [Arabis nemorensis]|uniref:Uncharacterized protein n=1 Tax=Arabis nemorensis TaxID=586526 RepID=A0A565CD80_9BRAS|nr:unnamed protein product [Arabis nemorensis]